MWDFVESLKAEDWNSKEFEMTLYRGTKSNRGAWCGKFYEPMTPDKIQEKFGGGSYVIYMKVPPGNQLRYYEEIEIVGAPKTDFSATSSSSNSPNNSEIAQVLAMMREDRQMFMAAIERMSGAGSSQEAVKQALTLNGQVFSAAMPAVVKTLEGVGGSGNHGAGPMDDLTRTFMQAAISKMLNPADPIEQFAKMAGAMGTLGYKMGGNPQTSLTTELARGLLNALPQLAGHVGGIMEQYRRAEEAKLQQVAIMRGGPGTQVITQPAAPAAPAPAPNVIQMPAVDAQPPSAEQFTQEQTLKTEEVFQMVETKVVELLMNTQLTPEEAANDAMTFISVMDRNLADELLRHGEPGLRWIFSSRPILMKVPAGPRLDAFIAELIKIGKEAPMPLPNPNIPVA